MSRIIDVRVDERDAGRNELLDPTAIGVTGCSRLGKGAFTIGAFDERSALGIPQEPGTGGVSAFRVVNTSPVEKNIASHGGRPSDPHNHRSFYPEQAEPLRRAIRVHLTRKTEPDGRIEPQPVATADLEESMGRLPRSRDRRCPPPVAALCWGAHVKQAHASVTRCGTMNGCRL
ncbi:glucuronyl esterase domain-containing protein [Sorangium sp. So ce1000]|uniref:glucuronyl esterase domain-containing protein n=1 Tax=Sorangium sp. So ce1000 TaxID=3133325 RepID=UPI003F60F9B4